MGFKYNPFTGQLDYWLESLTGAEIVALLEALAAGARLSHDGGLSDVSADDHHAQLHTAEHVTGGDDVIANAIAAGASGLMSGADKTKLDGIEALADVTDFTNVQAALAAATGAVDFNSQNLTGVGTIGCGTISSGAITVTGGLKTTGEIHVEKADLGVTAQAGTNLLLEANIITNYMSFLSPNTGYSGLIFGDPEDVDVGYILYYHGDNSLQFRANANIMLMLYGTGDVDITDHNAATVGLKLGGTLVTASAAELNILDGVTSTAAELNYLDGQTAQLILMNEVFS